MEHPYLCNFSQPDGRRIVVINNRHRQSLAVKGRLYVQWALKDTLTKRISITQLQKLKMGPQEEIAAAFGITGICQVLLENLLI